MNGSGSLDTLAATILRALLTSALESAALLALAMLVIAISRPRAATRHVLLWLVLAASAALPAVGIGASLARIEHVRPAAAPAPPAPPTASAGTVLRRSHAPLPAASAARASRVRGTGAAAGAPQAAARVAPPAALRLTTAALVRPPRANAAPAHAAALALGAWLAVAAFGLARLAARLRSLRRLKHRAHALGEPLVRRLRRYRYRARLGRTADIGVSDDVDVPVAIGFRHPTILFPRDLVSSGDLADLDQIAMHEYAHLERYDDWTNLAERAIASLYWFNPVVGYVARRLALEREIACDDRVVAQTGRAHRYAACLWKLVESAHLPARPLLAPGALVSENAIAIRIERLVDARRGTLDRRSPLGTLAVGALCALTLVAQAVRAPAIALADGVAPGATVAHRSPVAGRPPVPRPVPAPTASPSPAPTGLAATLRDRTIVVRIAADATPQALASAIALVVSRREHAAYRATVERSSLATIARRTSEIRFFRADARGAHARHAVAAAAEATDGARADAATDVAVADAANGVGIARDDARPTDRASLERCLGCDLHGVDLHGRDLHGLMLASVDLHGADLHGANLSGVRFIAVDLRGADLTGADVRDATLTGVDLRGASLDGAALQGVRLIGTAVRGVSFANVALRALVDTCVGCDLRGMDLHGQDLHAISLVGADLRDADLRGADVRGARLSGVDLRGARIDGADFSDASFTGCELHGLDLSAAHLARARFTPDATLASRAMRRAFAQPFAMPALPSPPAIPPLPPPLPQPAASPGP